MLRKAAGHRDSRAVELHGADLIGRMHASGAFYAIPDLKGTCLPFSVFVTKMECCLRIFDEEIGSNKYIHDCVPFGNCWC